MNFTNNNDDNEINKFIEKDKLSHPDCYHNINIEQQCNTTFDNKKNQNIEICNLLKKVSIYNIYCPIINKYLHLYCIYVYIHIYTIDLS